MDKYEVRRTPLGTAVIRVRPYKLICVWITDEWAELVCSLLNNNAVDKNLSEPS